MKNFRNIENSELTESYEQRDQQSSDPLRKTHHFGCLYKDLFWYFLFSFFYFLFLLFFSFLERGSDLSLEFRWLTASCRHRLLHRPSYSGGLFEKGNHFLKAFLSLLSILYLISHKSDFKAVDLDFRSRFFQLSFF